MAGASRQILLSLNFYLPGTAHVLEIVQISSLTSSDYFEKNPEFTAWLRDQRNVFFSDLSGTSAREYFEEFVELWNGRKLQTKYYSGISPNEARRSQHSWGLKGGLPKAKRADSGSSCNSNAIASWHQVFQGPASQQEFCHCTLYL